MVAVANAAVVVDFDTLSSDERTEALRQLASFAEDRYLHQTTIERGDGTHQFFEDLPVALSAADSSERTDSEREPGGLNAMTLVLLLLG